MLFACGDDGGHGRRGLDAGVAGDGGASGTPGAGIAGTRRPAPADRFEHVGAFIDAVQPFAAEEGLRTDDPSAVGLVPVDLAVGTRAGTRRSKALWLMVALAAIAGGLLGLWALRRPTPSGRLRVDLAHDQF